MAASLVVQTPVITILLAAALSLPPDATVARGWWWSEGCAPQRLESSDCVATETHRVHVIDRASGKPARAARVIWGTTAMLDDVPDAMLPFAITDDAGDAILHVPKDASVRVRVSGPALATWWEPLQKRVVILSGAKELVVAEGGAGEVLCSAQDDETATVIAAVQTREVAIQIFPAANAIVELEQPSMAAPGNALRAWAIAKDGRITLPAVPPMPYVVVVSSDEAIPLVMTSEPSRMPSRLELERGITVTGRVVDAKRKAIDGASIEAVFKVDGLPRGLRRRMRSAPNGRFIASGLPSGAIQLSVKQTGHANALRRVETRADLDLGDITLVASRDVALRVVDTAGDPVAGATLRTSDGVAATSDRNGVARLANVPDRFTLTAKARGFRSNEIDVNPKTEVIELSRGVRVIASLINAKTGNVLVLNNGARRVVAFENGVIDIAGFDAGTLALEIRANGLAPMPIAERVVVEDETLNLGPLQLNEGVAIAGRVVAEDAPVAGAVIRVLRHREEGPAIALVMRDWIETRTNDDGAFVISGLTDGSHVLIIEAAGFAPRVVTAEKDATIELDRARTVIVDCAPVHRCGDEARLLYGGAGYPWASSSALLRDGRAQIAVAPPGAALLRLVRDGQVIDERRIDIGEDDETTIAIRLGTTRVSGVVVADGRPRSGGVVELHRDLGDAGGMPVWIESRTTEGQVADARWLSAPARIETAVVDDAGRFTFDDVDPGEFQIAYHDDSGTVTPLRVVIPPAPEFRVMLTIPSPRIGGERVPRSGG